MRTPTCEVTPDIQGDALPGRESVDAGAELPDDDSDIVLVDPSASALTHLTLTPWDGRASKGGLSDSNLGLDRAFFNEEEWDPQMVWHLYKFTSECNYIYDENVISIELLAATDTRFGFPDGSTWLSFMEKVGKNERGTTLHIKIRLGKCKRIDN